MRLILLILFFISINTVNAEDDALFEAYAFIEDVSIATGESMSIYRAPAIASVITESDIASLGASTLSELLETVPGMHVSRSSIGFNPIFLIRGIYSDLNPQVLMLINGIPITNVYFGDRGQAWGRMPVNSIKRIEVIRGPGSAVYGADAFAGVINIITKTADDIKENAFGIRAGSFGTQEAWYEGKFDLGEWQGALIFEVGTTDGHDDIIPSDNQSFLDSLTGTMASLAPGEINTDSESLDIRLDLSKNRWRLRFGYQAREVGTGLGVGQALDPAGAADSDRLNLDATYSVELKEWNFDIEMSYFDVSTQSDLVVFPAGVDFTALGGGLFPDGVIGQPDVYERHTRVNVSAFYNKLKGHKVRIGGGVNYADMYRIEERKNFAVNPFGIPVPLGEVVDVTNTAPFITEEDRTVSFFFLQDTWNFTSDWDLTYGLRVDNYSDFGTTTNPRLAITYQAAYDKTFKILYGSAFRAPSFTELFSINNPVSLGNEDLDPEKIDTLEFGFSWFPIEYQFSINAFFYEIDDLIRSVPDASIATGNRAANIGQQEGEGLELEYHRKVSNSFGITLNLAFQSSEDLTTGESPGHAPERQFYFRGDWAIQESLSLNFQINAVMDRQRAFGDPRANIDDYTLVDVSLKKTWLENRLEGSLDIKNLFDEETFEPTILPGLIPGDTPLPDRSISATVRYKF